MTDRASNVTPLETGRTVSDHGGNGNGGGVSDRLARLETHMQYIAKADDLEKLKTSLVQTIEAKETAMLRWQIGIVLAAAVILVVAALIAK